MNVTPIPRCIPQVNASQMTETRGNFEANPRQREGSVTLPLSARGLLAKSQMQVLDRGALPADIGGFEKPFEWSLADLGMDPALVFHFDPGLGRLVEERQCQVLAVLQHGQQASFDLSPKGLLLPILIGRVRQCSIMDDSQALESLLGFGSD